MKWFHQLSAEEVRNLASTYGTPLYVYDAVTIQDAADQALAFPAPYGLTVRFAIKALPTRAILRLFAEKGLHFDASSGFEVERLLAAGIAAERISLSTQELPSNFGDYMRQGVKLNACSLGQLAAYGAAFPNTDVGLRFNPGLGSGHVNRTNVGGPGSSFGIWHEQVAETKAILTEHQLTAHRLHAHIGSGSDPAVWQRVVGLMLALVAQFEDVTTMNLGGGFKVGRMPEEVSTDLASIGASMRAEIEAFAAQHGRQLHLEIEPGTYLTAAAGAILAKVQDVVTTGETGYRFYKLDTGMTELLRPSLYGAQHPIRIFPAANEAPTVEALVVGHCCESGDILTPGVGDAEALAPRQLPLALAGDLALLGGAGAYASSMAATNYNSFPQAAEVLRIAPGEAKIIRKRQPLEKIWEQEID